MPLRDPEIDRRLGALESQVGGIDAVLSNLGVGRTAQVSTPRPAYPSYNPGVLIPGAQLFLIGPVSIPNNTNTVLTGWTTHRDSFSQGVGLGIDLPNGLLTYQRQAGDIGWLEFWLWASWAPNTSGRREIHWYCDDTSYRPHGVQAANNLGDDLSFQHRRVVGAADSFYYMEVYQNSGGALNLNYAMLSAIKLG